MSQVDTPAPDELTAHRAERTSDQNLRLVEIVFGVVIAQSLLEYRNIWLHPTRPGNWLAILALGCIYMTTIFSWVDFHRSMEKNPYLMHLQATAVSRRLDYLRLGWDLAIVIAYTGLLLSISEFGNRNDADLTRFLSGFALIFLLYFLSGLPRRWIYGATASRLSLLILMFCLYVLETLLYWRERHFKLLGADPLGLNVAAILIAFALMLVYRYWNSILRTNQEKASRNVNTPARPLRVGIDIDGVLADQITGLLPRLKEKFGLDLNYEDIDQWDKPVGDSDIATEIEAAFHEHNYILSMRAHPGAAVALGDLIRLGLEVVCITNRPSETEHSTVLWLAEHRIPHWSLMSAREARKSEFGLDILVDDYLGNILDFLNSTKGSAILVDQPWNRRREEVTPFLANGRLLVAASWNEISIRLTELVQRHSP